ncbi:hypothetical protein FRC10_007579 [Ceratobasidium sp. 414]|nr:hypothetical protein FRC10_007579 [Ceratobasidium sp. 414]
MALEPDPTTYLAFLRQHDSTFQPESKIKLAAERGTRKSKNAHVNAGQVRALHDFSAWDRDQPIALTPFILKQKLKTLTIYASVASLRGPTKYLVAHGEWGTSYGRMEQTPLRLKGVTDICIDSYEGFRNGAKWLCLHTPRFKYFLLQPAVAQTDLWNGVIPVWEATLDGPIVNLAYEDVDCNKPRPQGWLGLRSWKSWREWCKDTDGRTVIPGNEGRRATDLDDDVDSEDESNSESEHEYEETDEYASERSEDDASGQSFDEPRRRSTRGNLIRHPKITETSTSRCDEHKVASNPKRKRSAGKRQEPDESGVPEAVMSGTAHVETNEKVEGGPCRAGQVGSTAQAEVQPSTSDHDDAAAGQPKRARLTMTEMMNAAPSPPLEPAGTFEITAPAPVLPADQPESLPQPRFEQNAPALYLPGLHTLVRPAGSTDSFIAPTATTITPFNPLPPPAVSVKSLSENLADMAQNNGAPGTELQILAQLFSQPNSTILSQPMRPRTPPASQSTSADSLDPPPLDEEELEAPDGNWFASQEYASSFNLDLNHLFANDTAETPILSSPVHVQLPEDMYWDYGLRPDVQLSPPHLSNE